MIVQHSEISVADAIEISWFSLLNRVDTRTIGIRALRIPYEPSGLTSDAVESASTSAT